MNTLKSNFNFFRGHPSASLLPTKEVLEATTNVFQKVIDDKDYYDDVDNRHPLTYGVGLGNLEVRTAISKWLAEWFGRPEPSDPGCIDLTNGASFGIMNILAQTTSPHNGLTRRAFLVTPTYFLINDAFIDAGFGGKLSGIEELENGQIDTDALAKELDYYDSLEPIVEPTPENTSAIQNPAKAIKKKIYRYVMYCIPTFSNPRGGVLDLECKKKLLELSRKHDMLIICDDVYDFLDYSVPYTETPVLPIRLVYLDRDTLTEPQGYGNTVSNSTFSKIVGPGLRVGWQETATGALTKVIQSGGAHVSGGSPSHTNSVIVGELITSGSLNRIITNLRKEFSIRYKIFVDSVQKYMPQGTTISGGNGGYFLWVTLPDGYDCREISSLCLKEGVILANGDYFEVVGDVRGWGKQGARVSISFLSSELIEDGVKLWGKACETYKSNLK